MPRLLNLTVRLHANWLLVFLYGGVNKVKVAILKNGGWSVLKFTIRVCICALHPGRAQPEGT